MPRSRTADCRLLDCRLKTVFQVFRPAKFAGRYFFFFNARLVLLFFSAFKFRGFYLAKFTRVYFFFVKWRIGLAYIGVVVLKIGAGRKSEKRNEEDEYWIHVLVHSYVCVQLKKIGGEGVRE